MQLVIFGIDKDKNLIVQLPVFIQPYTQQPLVLYQLETVPVSISNQNDKAQSYTHLQIKKPYIILNSETYISLRQQDLRTCKRIGYEFYCEELFVVKHKTSYSCESAIYFNLDMNIIKAYRVIPRDPTNKIKAQLITKLRKIKKETNMDEGIIRLCILLVVSCLCFMGYQKSTKQAILSGLLSLAGLQSLLVWPQFLVRYSNL